MKPIPLALQLWSVRDETKVDFSGTVAKVAQIGYQGVELAGYGNLDPTRAKRAIEEANLKVAGMHVSYVGLTTDLSRLIAEAHLLETKHLVCSSWPKTEVMNRENAERIGKTLRSIGEELKDSGLRLSFHNHAHEMTLFDGRTVLEWMVPSGGSEDLLVELDVYWIHFGNQSPPKTLSGFAKLCRLIHLKDRYSLGSGPVDFPPIFEVIDRMPAVDWLIVEQEEYVVTPLESVKCCFEQMRYWGRG